MAERILLVGMMGAGKTSVGRLLAQRLGWAYLDSDDQVCRNTGRTVREIFESDGEAAFRREEARALEQAVAGDEDSVIAVAGGAVLDARNRERIRAAGTVVWLRAEIATLAERVASGGHRPLLDGDPAARLAALAGRREPLYASVADIVVDVDDVTPEEAVDAILDAVAR